MKRVTTILLAGLATAACGAAPPAITSIETGHTITKVRTASRNGTTFFVASSYEGAILAITAQGAIGWTNALSGFMNRDLWCADLDGDRSDEILAANADGTLYCLDSTGQLRWTFKPSDAPMNAVCVVHKDRKPYVVCGGYDMNLYYLSPAGELLKTVDPLAYSKEKPWGDDYKGLPPDNKHIANFIRPVRRRSGGEAVAVHGVIWSNSGTGHLYLFEPLEEQAYKAIKARGGVGELRVADIDGDGNDDVLTGASSMIQDAHVTCIDIAGGDQRQLELSALRRKVDGFGYRVVQPELVKVGGSGSILALFGSELILLPTDLDAAKAEVLSTRFSYNDLWKPEGRNAIVLASAQSGGSCIHYINLDDPGWKAAYAQLVPPGNIRTMLDGTAKARQQNKEFRRPGWERAPLPVYFLSDSRDGSGGPYIAAIEAEYKSPRFLNGKHLPRAENVDRSGFTPEYQAKRDRRMRYELTSDQMVAELLPRFDGAPGIAYWGGHGNDPFLTSLETEKRIFDEGRRRGKKVVAIYPELEQYNDAFAWVMENHFYPMASYAQGRNANLYIRTKHAFWNGIAYLPMWSRLVSGEFADVFIPALEETTDKTMEISVAARLGLWAAGSVDQWGARCARDNTSFDRLRQFSHQELPNHFLRQMVYNISCGATYLDNFSVDQDYMSFLWELVATGALYVPQRSELVSLSPVHIAMAPPDERFLTTGNNVKWLTFFNQEEEDANPMVFGRLNGTWPGAPATEWDFSRYAAGVKDRRLHFMPPYEHGIVAIAPPQEGRFADPKAPRGRMADHLHPIYKNIMKEYITDGRNYISADGSATNAANTFYTTIEADIENGAKHLPVTVSGNVAWVCAQSAPTHLRLTLVDSGYINPSAKTAVVSFHSVQPVRMTDLLAREAVDLSDPSHVEIDVPCGLFRFIDIELDRPFGSK